MYQNRFCVLTTNDCFCVPFPKCRFCRAKVALLLCESGTSALLKCHFHPALTAHKVKQSFSNTLSFPLSRDICGSLRCAC